MDSAAKRKQRKLNRYQKRIAQTSIDFKFSSGSTDPASIVVFGEDDVSTIEPISEPLDFYHNYLASSRDPSLAGAGPRPRRVFSALREDAKSSKLADYVSHSAASKHTGKDDRATSDQVLDPRTGLILFRFVSSGYLKSIHGCVSTGKEANVYLAARGTSEIVKADSARGSRFSFDSRKYTNKFGINLLKNDSASPDFAAIKIFKTSILVFKDRDKYVSGEHRFRQGYSRHNPRKMVKLWAEKEMRNLTRLRLAGVPVPGVLFLKQHVLVMEFIGYKGWPCPRLHDAKLYPLNLRRAYQYIIRIMRVMFQGCNLVHADLSEYNILWDSLAGHVWFIDVSYSVDSDNPMAGEFLRMDCKNVVDYFRRHLDSRTMVSPKQLFRFITNEGLDVRGESVEAYLEDLHKSADLGQDNDSIFLSNTLPRAIGDLDDEEVEARMDHHIGDATAKLTRMNPQLAYDGRVLALFENDVDALGLDVTMLPSLPASGTKSKFISRKHKRKIQHCSGAIVDTFKVRLASYAEKKTHKAMIKADAKERRQSKMKKSMKRKLIAGSKT